MGRGVREVNEFITGAGGSWHVLVRVSDRPVDQQRTSDDIFVGHETPVAAVQALIPVITQHKIVSLRNNQFAVLDQFLHLQPPAPLEAGHGKIQTRKLVAKSVVHTRAVADIRFLQRMAVYVDLAIDQADPVARDADDAFHEMLGRM